MSQESTFRAMIDRYKLTKPEYLPSEKVETPDPPVGYVVEKQIPPPLSCISVPPKPNGATLAEHPDGWSECLVTDKIKAKILSTPGFPAPLVHPAKAHRIGPAPGKGLGIFATRDLDMGDLVCVERPLLVLPSCVNHVQIGCPQDWPMEKIKRAMMFEWGKECHRAFERMEPGAQEAYLALANSHTEDGSGTTLGICRTNGFGIEGLADIIGTFEASYTGVCKDFSRANHSCRPNITRYFDRKAFAYCFSAMRPIKTGEEMTLAYSILENVRSARQQECRRYGFDCDCSACGPDFKASDKNRVGIVASVDDLDASYITWLVDKTLAKDELIKTSLRWIKVIESEGLECLEIYGRHLEAIHRAYVALGDEENAVKHGVPLGKWRRGFGELKPPVAWFSDPRWFQRRPDWAIRKA
ncbi:hypothetical protein BD779DRAFT_1804523 [Infundibulicybe gibba]|nr:hypothetical protein BD779DRAFT_1804523 [Infundibulicybe gibba]